jgi:hypothetical protein
MTWFVLFFTLWFHPGGLQLDKGHLSGDNPGSQVVVPPAPPNAGSSLDPWG